MNKLVVLALASLSLTGCATPYQPQVMPDNHYNQFPSLQAAAQVCLEKGMIDPSVTGQLNTALNYLKGTWDVVDHNRWLTSYNRFVEQFRNEKTTQADCNIAASYMHQVIGEMQGHQQQVHNNRMYNQQQQTINAINGVTNSINKPTNCMTTYGWTHCY